MASPQTREAVAARNDAKEKWRAHRKFCSQCDLAARKRHPAGLCATGRDVNADYRSADLIWRAEKAKDEETDPNQGELIPISEFRRP